MNTFYEHHENSIRFAYRCFDRILINGLIQPFQQPERVVGFFNTYRQQYPVSKAVFDRYCHAIPALGDRSGQEMADPDRRSASRSARRVRRAILRRAKPDQVVVIVKGREPARILTAIGKDDRWHLQ